MNDGNNISVPSWALETTQKEVLKSIIALGKTTAGGVQYENEMKNLTEKMFKQIKEGNKDTKEAVKEKEKLDKEALQASKELAERVKENKEALKEFQAEGPKGLFDKVADALESDGEKLGNNLGWMADKAVVAGGVLLGAVTSAGAYIGNALLGAGNQLNELTKSGVGFNTTYDDVNKNATEAIAGLGALGVGFEGAAQLIAANSNVVATQGFARFQDTMQYAADMSEELGMSFEDSMDTFSEGLQRRQNVMDLSNVSQGALNRTIRGTITAQRVYSQALGVSSEELETFVNSLTQNNGLLTSTLLTMNSGIRNQVMGGIEVFASGMAALGGQAGQGIATAFTDAAAAGAIGLSDEAVGYVTALPSLAGPMNEYISAVQDGTLTQEQSQQMVTDLTMSLGNLSSQEKARIKSLAAIGDESAKQMASAIAQFEQSENKIAELNKQFGTAFDMDLVQTGTNEFNKVLNQAKGAFSNAFYSLFADPGVIGALNDGLKEIMGVFGLGVDDMSGAAMGAGDMVKKLAEKAIPIIQSITKSLVGFAEYLKKGFEDGGIGGMISMVLSDAAGAIVKALIKYGIIFAGVLFAKNLAMEWAKTSLLPQAKAFGLKMFQGAAGAGKQLMQNAQKWMGTLLDSKGAKSVQDKVMKGAGILKDKIMGSDGKGGVGAKVADKLGSFQKDGAKMTDKLSGAMTKGGKSGGFLKSIADGVKKFGDTKVVKGAASLALLGGAVALAAVGLKQFNDVDFASIVKGTIALGGLAALTKVLGKGSSAMIKGAAAVAILGASIIPMAFGLKLMENVGMATIGVLAVGLITLTAAAVGMGFALPFILLGAVAIGALGVALIPLGFGLKLVSESLPGFVDSLASFSEVDGLGLLKSAAGMLAIAGAMALMAPLLPFMLLGSLAGPSIEAMGKSLQTFNNVDFKNLALAGLGMKAIADGMASMSGGSLKSSIMDGIGSIFGADSPIDKLKTFIAGFDTLDTTSIITTADALQSLSDSLSDLSYVLDRSLEPLMKLSIVLDNMSGVGIMKLAAIKALNLMGVGSAPDSEAQPTIAATPGQNNAMTTMGQAPIDSGMGPGIAVPFGGSGTQTPIDYGKIGEDEMLDDMFAREDTESTIPGMETTPKTTDPSVTQKAAQTMAQAEDPEQTTLTDLNNTLMALLDAQNQNNRTAKKQQRSIEGLEI